MKTEEEVRAQLAITQNSAYENDYRYASTSGMVIALEWVLGIGE